MGIFDLFRQKKKQAGDFSDINSNEKLMQLYQEGVLAPLYLMPIKFGGNDSAINKLFVPPVVVGLKNECDSIIENLLDQEKVDAYKCTPEYKNNSLVPSKITVSATKGTEEVFTQTINIW